MLTLYNAEIKPYTSFKIGGAVERLHFPETVDDLTQLISGQTFPVILGSCSNVLISDSGIAGDVILTTKMNTVKIENDLVTCGCGATLKNISESCAASGLTGLEFTHGIPGTIGGAVFMNAGAYGFQISDLVVEVVTIERFPMVDERDSYGARRRNYSREDCRFSYRNSRFQQSHEVICEVTLRVSKGNQKEIYQKMEELDKRRSDKQPLDLPSAGSIFKRPTGFYTGSLIESAGLKGVRIGDAAVSTKHAGFIVNLGNATAKDVSDLIQLVKNRVKSIHGVDLETEVRFIG